MTIEWRLQTAADVVALENDDSWQNGLTHYSVAFIKDCIAFCKRPEDSNPRQLHRISEHVTFVLNGLFRLDVPYALCGENLEQLEWNFICVATPKKQPRQFATGAMPPPGREWMIGQTATVIEFVGASERFLEESEGAFEQWLSDEILAVKTKSRPFPLTAEVGVVAALAWYQGEIAKGRPHEALTLTDFAQAISPDTNN